MFHWVLNKPLNVEMKTPEQFHLSCSEDFIADFQDISHIGFHACFTYFTHISHINASNVDSKEISTGWEVFQKYQ